MCSEGKEPLHNVQLSLVEDSNHRNRHDQTFDFEQTGSSINHMLIDMGRPQPELGWGYHVPRMLLQPVLIWLALWTSKDPRRR